MNQGPRSILDRIHSPEDLRKLPADKLPGLCQELRQFIIDSVAENPGHFASSLGVVELTVALHHAYETPNDLLVWDVGHQAYGHKILTGRRDVFHTNRKYGGISGFPSRSESKYDTFGVGHASTSISAALGMAIASRQKNIDRKVVAVIGDGAMTGGLAFEGLNNAGAQNADLLVVLNDNRMSIDPNVGALKEYLLDIATSSTYNKIKDEIWSLLGKMSKVAPKTRVLAQQIEHALKTSLLQHSNLFESLNFRYFGPVDGHDVIYLSQLFKDLRNIQGPKLLHVVTKKGKGFRSAELDATLFHAPPGQFDRATGEFYSFGKSPGKPVKYQEVFGKTLAELAEKNPDIVAITPAMPTGSHLTEMAKTFPDRVFDVGIAEQHAVTFSAGLATQGLLPFCTIYSTFLQRALDQVIHDVAIQNLPVILCVDRGGLVGHDGSTHHGVFDIVHLRSVPNMVVAAPMDEIQLRHMLYSAQLEPSGPFAIRYPRTTGVFSEWKVPFEYIKPGTARQISKGKDLSILSLGHPGNSVIKAVRRLEKLGYSIQHFDMRFAKPLDEHVLHDCGKNFNQIITVEDGVIAGGFGSAVMEFMNEHKYNTRITRLGVPDRFITHGSIDELQHECGYDVDGIYSRALDILRHKVRHYSNVP